VRSAGIKHVKSANGKSRAYLSGQPYVEQRRFQQASFLQLLQRNAWRRTQMETAAFFPVIRQASKET
jgi:hypothetical protein